MIQKEKSKKGVSIMAENIGRIFGGGNNYSIGYNVKKQADEQPKNEVPQAPIEQAHNEIDPNKVFDFLNANIAVTPQKPVIGKNDPEMEARIGASMERFEQLYGVIQKEVGDEYAPAVMDAVLDKKFAIN